MKSLNALASGMKQLLSIIAVVTLCILAGCTSAKVVYRSKAMLTPALDAGQYDIALVIEDVSDPANPSVVGGPQLSLLKGREATISIGEETESKDGCSTWSGIKCTVIVDDASGKLVACTTVSVEKDGKVVWLEKQTVAMLK